jgi:CRISPR/Cas system-associated protein Cas5 (RAMP superfamily)
MNIAIVIATTIAAVVATATAIIATLLFGPVPTALVLGAIAGACFRLVLVKDREAIALQAMAARFAKDQAEYDAESDPFKDVGKPPFVWDDDITPF